MCCGVVIQKKKLTVKSDPEVVEAKTGSSLQDMLSQDQCPTVTFFFQKEI